ncbi:hypothetical protein [Bacillus velezensis]
MVDRSQYTLHPSLLDAALQATIAFLYPMKRCLERYYQIQRRAKR